MWSGLQDPVSDDGKPLFTFCVLFIGWVSALNNKCCVWYTAEEIYFWIFSVIVENVRLPSSASNQFIFLLVMQDIYSVLFNWRTPWNYHTPYPISKVLIAVPPQIIVPPNFMTYRSTSNNRTTQLYVFTLKLNFKQDIF